MFKMQFSCLSQQRYKCLKSVLTVLTSLYLLVFNLAASSIYAEAATFTHSHGSGCYKTESFTCSNHSITSYSETQSLHCPNCLVHTSHTVTGYSDRCNNGLIGDVPVAYKEQCNVCGYARKDDPVSLNGPHTSTRSVLACALPTGNLASVSMSGNVSGWTNMPVVLSVSVDNAVSGFSLAAVPYNFGQGYTSSNSYSVTSNGTYSASVKASDGSEVSVSFSVSNIDTDLPSLSLSKSTDKWTESGLTIEAVASDNASGLASEPYSFNGGAYTSNASFPVTSNGTYSISAKDNAGNVRTESITISNIGRDPEVVAKEKAEEEARKKAEEEARRKAAEEEARKKAAEEEARKKAAEEEARKKAAEEEARRKAAEEEERRKAAEEEANRKTAEEEAKKQAETSKRPVTGSTASSGSVSSSEGNTSGGLHKIPVKDATGNVVSTDKQFASIGTNSGNGNSTGANAGKDNIGTNPDSSNGLVITPGTAGTLSGLLKVTDATTSGNQNSDLQDADNGLENASDGINSEISKDYSEMSNENHAMGFSAVTNMFLRSKAALVAGIVLLAAGLAILLNLNYVYTEENGKTKLVSAVKVKRSEKRIILYISESKLIRDRKYKVYLSPLNKYAAKDKRMYVMIMERDVLLNVDEGIGFTY